MNVGAANAVIRKFISENIIKESYDLTEMCSDTDGSEMCVTGNEDAKQLQFSYRGIATPIIMSNGGKDMLETIYKNYYVPSGGNPLYEISL